MAVRFLLRIHWRLSQPQPRLQGFVLFPQSEVFGKQCSVFFKQFVNVHHHGILVHPQQDSTGQAGIEIGEKPTRGMDRESQANVTFRRIREEQALGEQLPQERSAGPLFQT